MTFNVELLAKGLNNALIAYHDIVCSLCLGCQVPLKFEVLRDIPDEEMQARLEEVKKLYKIVCEIESSGRKTIEGEDIIHGINH